MKHAWIPTIVLCAACTTTPSTARSPEASALGPACCTPGCCDDDPDCCEAAPGATMARAEPSVSCAVVTDCCDAPTSH